MTSHSHHTDRANKADRAVAWLLKLQRKMLGDAYLLFSCRASQGLSQFNLYVMWLLWEEKVLIREIWLNIFNTSIIITFIRLLLILPFYLSNIFACNCSYEKNIIVRSNREYNCFGNLLEDDYFASYSSTSTQKVLVLEYEYTSTITPSQLDADMNIYKSNSFLHLPNTFT